MLNFIHVHKLSIVGWLTFFLVVTLYLFTLQPSIGWYNSPELVCAAMTSDVPHAPGYPLFTRLAQLFIKVIPFDEPARRVNLLSAILGAAAAALWTILLVNCGIAVKSAFCAGIWLACVPVFWNEAVTAEVYTLECLLLAMFFNAVAVYAQGKITPITGFWLGLSLFLGLTHRPTFLMYALAAWPLVSKTELQQKIDKSVLYAFALGALIGISPAIDLYVRLQNENRILIDPLIGKGFNGFLRFFAGAEYGKALGVFGAAELYRRFESWLYVISGAGILMPILALYAVIRMLFIRNRRISERRMRLLKSCVLIVLFNSGFILNYNALEAHTMLLPSLMGLAGSAAVSLTIIETKKLRRAMLLVLFALILTTVLNGSSKIDPQNHESEQFTYRMMALIPKSSLVLMNNDIEFRPFYYLRLTRNFRPDVAITLVDALTDEDALALAPYTNSGKLFGSLVYPPNAAQILAKHFKLEPWGYVWHIFSGNSLNASKPNENDFSHLKINANATLFVDKKIEIIPLGSLRENKNANVISPYDVIVYRYFVETISSASIEPFVLKAELTDEYGHTLENSGIKTGHDIHVIGSEVNVWVQRAIVVPPLTKTSKLFFRTAILPINGGCLPKNWVLDTLPCANALNEDGETELFRLKFGFGGKALFSADRLYGIDAVASVQSMIIDEFSTSCNNP